MALNISKTKIVHFRRKRGNKPRSIFTFNRREVTFSSSYKYLGLTHTEHLEWDIEICAKANRALALLNYRARACGRLPESIYSQLFKQLVESIVMCNACIWGHRESKDLLNIQTSALRFLLGVGKTRPKAELFGETGLVPFTMSIKFNIFKFRKRIAGMDDNRITKKFSCGAGTLQDLITTTGYGKPRHFWIQSVTLGGLMRSGMSYQKLNLKCGRTQYLQTLTQEAGSGSGSTATLNHPPRRSNMCAQAQH